MMNLSYLAASDAAGFGPVSQRICLYRGGSKKAIHLRKEVDGLRWDKSEFDRFGGCCEGGEGSDGVLEVENLGIAVIFIVHSAQVGVGVQHGLLSLDPVIFSQFTGNANPGALMECADFYLGVSQNLLGARFDLTGLDVQLTLENMGGAKGTDSGLITLDGCQIVNTGILQKFAYSFHVCSSCVIKSGYIDYSTIRNIFQSDWNCNPPKKRGKLEVTVICKSTFQDVRTQEKYSCLD